MKAPTEPEALVWLTQERLEEAKERFKESKSLLREAGLLESALRYWVQTKIAESIKIEDEDKEMEELSVKWRKSNPEKVIEEDELRKILRIKPACLEWSKQQWGHTVDSIYLKQKNNLSKASCRLIRVQSKDWANELYHRIKNEEISFEQAAIEYGEGAEMKSGGLIPLKKLVEFPFGLAPLMERLKEGELSPPLKLGKGFCIVKLIKYVPSQLDDETINGIHFEMLMLWIQGVVETVSDAIK